VPSVFKSEIAAVSRFDARDRGFQSGLLGRNGGLGKWRIVPLQPEYKRAFSSAG
jgi:hypothetical protein